MKFKEESWTEVLSIHEKKIYEHCQNLSVWSLYICLFRMNVELTFYLTICILLLITLHFLGPIENIQEDAGQLKSTTKEIGQDVRQIKDDVTKIKGWYSFFSFFDVETLTKLWTKMPKSSKYDIAGGHRSKVVSWSI